MKEEKSGVLDWFSRRLNLTEIFSLLTSYGVFHAELSPIALMVACEQ